MTKKILLAAVACLAFVANDVTAQVARTEYLAFGSVTLSDAQFLVGAKDGRQVGLAGQLRIPRPGTDRLPAVIFLHGSGGVGGTGSPTDEWATEFNRLGIATFTFDSFSGRGIVNTVADQSQLGRLAMIIDAYRALELLAKHSRIDSSRVALMGFSRGGQATLYASVRRFQKMHGPAGDLGFAAYIALYPNCGTTYRNDEEVVDTPVRILHGADDNYVPVAPCRSYVERLAKAGRDVQLIEYPGAHHVFDGPAFRQPVAVAAAQTTRRCSLIESDSGQILNRDTQKPFSYADACVEKGPTVAYNEAAANQARMYLREFLSKRFALK